MNVVPSLGELFERRFNIPDFDLTTFPQRVIIQGT